MRTKVTIAALAVGALLVAVIVGPSGTASARWAYGNGPSDLDLIDANPAVDGLQFCTGEIGGRAGLSLLGAPGTNPTPPGPYGTRTVSVFVANTTFDGAQYDPGGIKLATGEVIAPTLTQVTPELQQLDPQELLQSDTDPGQVFSVYAAAPFTIKPAPGVIVAGQFVALRLVGVQDAFVAGNAVTCESPAEPTVTQPPATQPTTTATTSTSIPGETTVPTTDSTEPADTTVDPSTPDGSVPDTTGPSDTGDVAPASAATPVSATVSYTG